MSIRFSGGERFQRGRGIGGLLRLAKGLFKPAMETIGRVVKSNTGKAVGRVLKKQAIETATNLAGDILSGNSFKEGVEREVNNIKGKAASHIQQLGNDNNNNNCKEIKRRTKKVQYNKPKGRKKTGLTNKKPKVFKWLDKDSDDE